MPRSKIEGMTLRNGEPTTSVRDACASWGISLRGFRKRLERGFSVRDALSEPKWSHDGSHWVDHEGKEYPSGRALAQAWGLTNSQLEGRLRRGYTMEQALTTPRGKRVEGALGRVAKGRGGES